jgi:nitrate/TMAO reductase-like tetraheme cytochrome c subunit
VKKFIKNHTIASIAGACVIVVALVAGGIAGVRYHDTPQFCALCHNMQPYLASWDGSSVSKATGMPFLANDHAKNGEACLNCHKPELQQQVSELIKYVTTDTSAPLAQRKFPDSFCLACHGTREEVAAKTADYTVKLVDIPQSYLDTFKKAGYAFTSTVKINPHTVPVASGATDPHVAGGPLPACNNCHSMHHDSAGIDYCYSCHHTQTFAPCSICHNDSNSDAGGD